MTFLKNLGESISKAAGSAAEKAKEMAEVASLKMAINSQEKDIKEAYFEIGKAMYELEKGKEDSPCAELCGKITAAMTEIENLKAKIVEVKGDDEIEDKDTPE